MSTQGLTKRIALNLTANWLIPLTLSVAPPDFLIAQKADRESERPFSLRIPVDMVVVPVTVEDGDGKPLYGLQKEDFELLEENVPQQLSYFSADPYPLSVAIQLEKTMDAGAQKAIEASLLNLIESFSGFDEIALFQFEHTTDKLQDFTLSKDEILNSFRKISLKGRPPAFSGGPFSSETTVSGIPLDTGKGRVPPPKTLNTHIDDAVFTAAQELRRRSRNRRKVIVMISNGQNAPGNRNSYESTLEAILSSEIVVYGIAQGTALLYRKMNSLTKYAHSTGGAVFYPVKSGSFPGTYQKIAQMARNQYVLGYVPQNDVEKVTFRRISVRIKNKEIKAGNVRNRKGYYSVPRL